MEYLIPKDIKPLIEQAGNVGISIYMPTYHSGKKVVQNPIRFKNLYHLAEKKLLECGYDKKLAEELIKPAQRLYETTIFWQYQKKGLAVFISQNVFLYFRLPVEVEEIAEVSRYFHLIPIFELLNIDRGFYLLALSKKNLKLYEASHFSLVEIPVEGLPANIDEAVPIDDSDKSPQFRTIGPPRSGKRAAVYHGHAGRYEAEKERIAKYFHIIENALHKYFAGKTLPLILACDDSEFPIYRDINRYPYLVADRWVSGNPDGVPPEVLRDKAWELLEPIFNADMEKAKELYGQLSHTERASNRIEDILPAAFYGRVSEIFIQKGAHIWGDYNHEEQTLVISEEQDLCCVDLLNLAAVQTYLHHGAVYVLPKEQMPEQDSPVAAVFRY